MEHCEFPYGGVEPTSALSPLLGLGWLVAGLLFLIILALLASRGGRKPADSAEVLEWKYGAVRHFVDAAARSELETVLSARRNLQEAITQLFGKDKTIPSDLGRKLAALRDAPKEPPPAKPPAPAPPPGAPATPIVTTLGATLTINLPPTPAPPGGAPPAAPPSFNDRLAEVKAAVLVFAEYWSDKPERMLDLQTARNHLTQRGALSADLEKLRSGASISPSNSSGRGAPSSTTGPIKSSRGG